MALTSLRLGAVAAATEADTFDASDSLNDSRTLVAPTVAFGAASFGSTRSGPTWITPRISGWILQW